MRPIGRIFSFKKKGIPTYFFPFLGIFQKWKHDQKGRGEAFISSKEFPQEFPGQKYMVTHISKYPLLLLRDPQYIKEFYQNPNMYHKTKKVEVLKLLVGNGLTTIEDDVWQRHRKIMSSCFNYDFLKTKSGMIQNITKEYLDQISPAEYKDFKTVSKLEDITAEAIGRVFFGERLCQKTFEGQPLSLASRTMDKELSSVYQAPAVFFFGASALKWPIFPQYNKVLKRMNDYRDFILKVVQESKTQPLEPNTLLASLLETQKSSDPESRFSDQDIVDEFISLFTAGLDNTSRLAAMTLYCLNRHPEHLKELKEERDRTYNKEKEISADTLQKMDTLQSVLKETLRFYVPTPIIFFRIALKDHNLLDLQVKEGDLVIPDFFSQYFDQKNFKNPQEFNPSRWKNPDPKLDPYAFIPFSTGPRNCIGQHLAIMISRIIVSEFLERFNFKLKDGYKLEMAFRLFYEPDGDLLFNLEKIGA